MDKVDFLVLALVACVLGIALAINPPSTAGGTIAISGLTFALGYCAEHVLGLVRRKRESRVPRPGCLVYLRPRRAPQAVRKERRA